MTSQKPCAYWSHGKHYFVEYRFELDHNLGTAILDVVQQSRTITVKPVVHSYDSTCAQLGKIIVSKKMALDVT
ncbi:hypothetical protein E2P81_ATG06895 [Venturia nashicola]|uniref:Uncharacterized protein n=1 Tax=Venturia nashicola TaxID=86259 RepID=A0A4Z1PBB1_9PEZI|nr:hypothetical protein E6O75_ATG07065 [Venturia nashicola]TLD30242.1 hypothetical protein E2P81_ATG06895 [Venturia nashicola]